MPHIRRIVDLSGIVQGVGFRPAVFRLATDAGLGGWVQNRTSVVRLALEGTGDAVERFLSELPRRLPPNARIERMTLVSSESFGGVAASAFSIRESDGEETQEVLIPADLAMCADCRSEILDPRNRRYGYAFTTCTRCGPRYTVVTDMPYDRERTTMRAFPMCAECRREYGNPADRRFHAESTACPVCGPRLSLVDRAGRPVGGEALRRARLELSRGRLVAVRGIGGFLLAADAFDRDALAALRARKNRPHKPFAVMAPDLETVRRYCNVPAAAAVMLESPEAPIVILDVRPEAVTQSGLPLDLIAPDTQTLGVMLPTTPLHLLLAQPLEGDPVGRFDLLAMTSGNRRGEPICVRNDEALQRLGDIADFLLIHDREINLRCDDSVCIVQGGAPQVWRRARGYAPNPIRSPVPLCRSVLALGADLKNAIALGYGDRVVLSPHVGDLDTPEALDGLEQAVLALPAFLKREPEAIAVDRHPDMQSSLFGRRLAAERGLPAVAVQHHHAHAVACLAEHGFLEGLALVMDGTGWGGDGTIWGAELLRVRGRSFDRLATFKPVPLPGGDAAVRRPARQLVARWVEAGVEISDALLARSGTTSEEAEVWAEQGRRGLNAPLTHGAGRLFDALSAALGFAPATMTYEGQPAIRLEAAARKARDPAEDLPYRAVETGALLEIDWSPAFAVLSAPGALNGRENEWALSAHRAVAKAAVEMITYGLSRGGDVRVALSGGVFMNRILNALMSAELERMGIPLLRHRQTPPGDGCVALGQAIVAGI